MEKKSVWGEMKNRLFSRLFRRVLTLFDISSLEDSREYSSRSTPSLKSCRAEINLEISKKDKRGQKKSTEESRELSARMQRGGNSRSYERFS